MDTKPFDVFISHSSKDMHAASAIKQHLQAAGIRCWKAPDDIMPGESWPQAIMRALGSCRAMVLVWSANSTQSPEVSKELTLAMQGKVTVIPFRIEDVQPSGEWAYHLANTHWMNAFPGELEDHLDGLATYIGRILPDRAPVVSGEAPPVAAAPTFGFLEKLVEAAVSDGIVTDEEMKILFARAQALGVGDAELQLLIRAKLEAVPKAALQTPIAPPTSTAVAVTPSPSQDESARDFGTQTSLGPHSTAELSRPDSPASVAQGVETTATPKRAVRAAKARPAVGAPGSKPAVADEARSAADTAATPKRAAKPVAPPSVQRPTKVADSRAEETPAARSGGRLGRTLLLGGLLAGAVFWLLQPPTEQDSSLEQSTERQAPATMQPEQAAEQQAAAEAEPKAAAVPPQPRVKVPIADPDAADGNASAPVMAGRVLPAEYASITGPGFSCKGSLNRAETAICYDPRLARADGVLNAVYSDVRRALPPEEAARLKAEQLAWLKVRDTSCRFPDESPFRGCLLSSMERRIGDLLDRKALLGG